MKPLFRTAIYVNRAIASLPKAIKGKDVSDPIIEHKPWTSGEKLFGKATESGCDLALIFAQYEKLEYWAIAKDIAVLEEDGKRVTRYQFSNLQRISGRTRKRNDLTVISTGKPLSNDYIRSYSLVKTPDFLLPAFGEKKRQ